MKPQALIQIAGELLREWRCSPQPADAVARNFYRVHRSLGSHDRRIVGDAFYHTLRHLRRIDDALKGVLEGTEILPAITQNAGFPVSEPPNDRVWANPPPVVPKHMGAEMWLDAARCGLALTELRPDLLAAFIEEMVRAWPGKTPDWSAGRSERILRRGAEAMEQLRLNSTSVYIPIRHSIPDWLWALMGSEIPRGELDALGASLNEAAPISLRVNTLRTSRRAYEDILGDASIECRRGELCDAALHLRGRVATGSLPGLEDGLVEMQDEGSQVLGLLCQAIPGLDVIDACAGAGGKALHLASLMANRGRIRVHDPAASRLERLWPRAVRSGATIIEKLPPGAAREEPAPGDRADLVLVDAPCSGTGTIRRHPELRWRVTREVLAQRIALQDEILERWSHWVKPGGRLVYATCSLLGDENDRRVDAFLARHPEFERIQPQPGDWFASMKLLDRHGDLRLLPHRHGCDGFYGARLRRNT